MLYVKLPESCQRINAKDDKIKFTKYLFIFLKTNKNAK